jgi:hypothetical protein
MIEPAEMNRPELLNGSIADVRHDVTADELAIALAGFATDVYRRPIR